MIAGLRRADGISFATALLLLGALVAPSFNFVALPPVLPDIAAHFGGGEHGRAIAQGVQALPFFGLAIGGLFVGWIIERIGTRRAIVVAAIALLVAGIGGATFDGAMLLLVSCAVIGLAASLATSALAALTGTMIDDARRGRVLGVQVAVSDICTVTGGVAAAVLAQALGWHGPFLIFVAFAAFLLIGVAAAPPLPSARAPAGSGLLRMAKLAWATYLGAGFVFLVVATQATQLPFYLEQLGYVTTGSRAVITTFALFAAMCGSISFALLQGRAAPWQVQALSVLAATAGFAGFALWRGDLAFGLAATFLVGAGVGLTVPVVFASALQRAPEGLRGHSIGLLNVAIFFGSFISPVILSPVAATLGYEGLYALIAAVVAIVGVARVIHLMSTRAGSATVPIAS